ncbi:MAG: tetratricopeptide repeat protein [bacterium]
MSGKANMLIQHAGRTHAIRGVWGMKGRLLVGLLGCLLLALPVLADPGGDPSDQINPQARYYYDLGMNHFRKKEWNQAIQAYLQAVGIEPRFPEAWNNLGFCYRKMGNNQRALDAYRRAIDLRPDFASAHEYIGRLYIAMGNRDAAMRHYDILRRLDAKLAAELLQAIQANNSDYGE